MKSLPLNWVSSRSWRQVLRGYCLSGRRYETSILLRISAFKSEPMNPFIWLSLLKSIINAIGIIRDWKAAEIAAYLYEIWQWMDWSSWFGDNVSLIRDPNGSIRRSVRLAFSTPYKDMGWKSRRWDFAFGKVHWRGRFRCESRCKFSAEIISNILSALEMITRVLWKYPCLTMQILEYFLRRTKGSWESDGWWLKQKRFNFNFKLQVIGFSKGELSVRRADVLECIIYII